MVEPGQIVGPYLLSHLVDVLGRKSVHPNMCHAFHPPELVAPDHRLESTGALSLLDDRRDRREDFYRLGGRFAGGSHGEVWRAQRIDPYTGTFEPGFVLKRMLLEKGAGVHAAALREVHFGELLRDLNQQRHFARYVEHFYRYGAGINGQDELWLVFHDEGASLQKYLYTELVTRDFVVHGQSDFWRTLRLTREGHDTMRDVLRQLLSAVATLHDLGIVHRDLKPSNLIVTPEHPQNQSSTSSSTSSSSAPPLPPLSLRVADFSSAIDASALEQGLFGLEGPTRQELSIDYAPPEVLFDADAALSSARPDAYDMWSVGVIFLEMVLGTPQAQQKHWPLGDSPVISEACGEEELAKACGEEELAKAVLARDHLDIGLPPLGLDLLRRLLQWDPLDRITAAQWDALERITTAQVLRHDRFSFIFANAALRHDYFIFTAADAPHVHQQHRQRRAHSTSSSTETLSLLGSPNAPPLGGYLPAGEGGGAAREGETAAAAAAAALFAAASPAAGALAEIRRGDVGDSHVPDPLQGARYVCPVCGRSFDVWESCHRHVGMRRHGRFCSYSAEHMPTCISTHSMLPIDSHSGWCDIVGRRRTIEDYHALVFHKDWRYFGVFDGHNGSRAAKFASRQLHANLEPLLRDALAVTDVTANSESGEGGCAATGGAASAPGGSVCSATSGAPDTKEVATLRVGSDAIDARIEHAVLLAFQQTQDQFMELEGQNAFVSRQGSGTTATIALTLPGRLVVANVGDSRAVLCCSAGSSGGGVASGSSGSAASGSSASRSDGTGSSSTDGGSGSCSTDGGSGSTSSTADGSSSGSGSSSTADGSSSGGSSAGGSGSSSGSSSSSADGSSSSGGSSSDGISADGSRSSGGSAGGGGSRSGSSSGGGRGEAVVVTLDHTPRDATEAARVTAAGGAIEIDTSGAPRVEGGLAVTRRIGSGAVNGRALLSSRPDVRTYRFDDPAFDFRFLIVASDGLWDVVSSEDAVAMVEDVVGGAQPGGERPVHLASFGEYGVAQAWQVAATVLTHMAYVQGSTDNIGVCVVSLQYEA
ncbi:hypothetical protein JKP88DRAFT_306842 [Tribonema minus]|uniref:Uncharacterized protein n=1 Tax=Tribonema minus TaxID=303371 RepID=A0A836CIC2_9STRA|nr:hypothetical protein JKP88DRAFT_306842 [Tribonema minus]